MKLISKALMPILFAISVFGLIACGGGGGGDSSSGGTTAGSPPGIYEGSYDTRSNGRILIGVNSDGTMSVTVDDNPGGTYFGEGVLSHDNSFSVTCGNGTDTLTVSGTLTGSGVGRTFAGTVASGTFTTGYTATFRSTPGISNFAGQLNGSWRVRHATAGHNIALGYWDATINNSGQATGTWRATGQNVALAGTVNPAGTLEMSGTANGGIPVVVRGNLSLINGQPWGTGYFTWGDFWVGDFQTWANEGGRVLINKSQPNTHPPRTGVYAMDYTGGNEQLIADLVTGAYTLAATQWSQYVFSTNDALWIKPGGTPVRIQVPDAAAPFFVHNAAFAPNGTSLAFTADAMVNGESERVTYVSKVTGNSITATKLREKCLLVSWYPDGKTLLCRDETNFQYFAVPVDGSAPFNVAQTGAGAALYDVDSNTGKVLAKKGGWLGFFEMDSENFVQLVDLSAFNTFKGFFWSADGRYAIYATPEGDNWNLLRISAEGGIPQLIKVLTNSQQPVDAIAF